MRMSIVEALLCVALVCASGCVSQAPRAFDPNSMVQAKKIVDRGTMLLRQGELEGAAASFRVSYDIQPTPAALDGLGAVAYLEGNYQMAEDYFIEAYNLDNTYYEAVGNLALLYETVGLSAKARKLYELSVEKDPKNFRVRNNFAAFLYDKDIEGEERARVELVKAEVLAPHPLIDYNLKMVERVTYGKN